MAQITPIRGFTNTPISRSICIITTLVAISLSILQLKHLVKLSIDPYIIEYSQYWRILTYQLSVINESDYLLVVILWFHYKNLERFYGSRKYFSIIVIFAVYNSAACFLFMSIGQLFLYYIVYLAKSVILKQTEPVVYQSLFFNEIVPGPLGIVSSLYICYGTYIPVSYHFKILLSNPIGRNNDPEEITETDQESGPDQRQNVQSDNATSSGSSSPPSTELCLTNHFPIHILYTLLLLNNGTRSLIPCLVGLFIGKLHTYELLPGSKNWLMASSIFRFFVNPSKFINQSVDNIRIRITGGYQSVSSGSDSIPVSQDELRASSDLNGDADADVEGEDAEEIVEDGRHQREQIRAETPVRPLGSQFLDTFRT
ncbi:uncharacterized protein RJT20DRAFT_49135 [Scheffersomyces xylosifermentans]|uniref:uncharacterized protein n=1 Tax=Scheffersomyces xylosifermentans TaxID=1304137 RepID=UPI00315DAA7D